MSSAFPSQNTSGAFKFLQIDLSGSLRKQTKVYLLCLIVFLGVLGLTLLKPFLQIKLLVSFKQFEALQPQNLLGNFWCLDLQSCGCSSFPAPLLLIRFQVTAECCVLTLKAISQHDCQTFFSRLHALMLLVRQSYQ